jgi:hypothetical protein
MAAFLRPELRAAAWRWREVLAGSVMAVFGIWWIIATTALTAWLGGILVLVGVALFVTGFQRARFRTEGGGPGMVQVTEAEIAYFGPLTGGVITLDLIETIVLDPTGKPLHWILMGRDGRRVHIPVTAADSELLLDAFAQLPGFRTEQMLDGLAHPGRAARVIWRRPPPVVVALPPRVH